MEGIAMLAPFNRHSENVVIEPIIVPELELRNVKMQVFLTPDDPALEDAPEALNRIGVHCADNVLAMGVINGDVRERLFQIAVACPLIGAEQANFVRHGFVDESFQSHGANVLNDTRHDIALSTDSALPEAVPPGRPSRLSVCLL
jgi:hypothetical protein